VAASRHSGHSRIAAEVTEIAVSNTHSWIIHVLVVID
jgi:hypothetical protein